MAECSSHVPGTFSWVELATTDQKAAVAFYRALLGWDVNEIPMGPNETYSMLRLRGQDVAAASSLRPEEREGGGRPHWNLYVSVANADEAVKRAQGFGATVLSAPFDVMDAGRMAVLQDPTGAVFEVWQPKAHIGARILNEPGALCWSELTTRDTKSAEAFYTKLFAWTPKHSAPGAGMEYTEFSNQGPPSIGMLPMPANMPAGVPSYWMPYLQVADCDAASGRASELGSSVMMPARDIESGRIAILKDPQGAMFGVYNST